MGQDCYDRLFPKTMQIGNASAQCVEAVTKPHMQQTQLLQRGLDYGSAHQSY